MSIVRSLDSFSLPELFKLIETDCKSGRLIIETPISQDTDRREGIYYLWFENGCLIAISNCLNQKGLINLISQRGWLSPLVISKLRTLCPTNTPLGLYLNQMRLLSSENISLIFQLQLHQVYRLFQLSGGRFRFDDFTELKDRILTIPWLEMTGHRIKTSEVSMYALRLMEHSDSIAGQLPMPGQVLRKIVNQPHVKLTALERKVWDCADSQTSLLAMAKITQHSITTIQLTAFRLMVVGLVDDIFQARDNWEIEPSNHQSLFHSYDNQAIQREESGFLATLGGWFKNHS